MMKPHVILDDTFGTCETSIGDFVAILEDVNCHSLVYASIDVPYDKYEGLVICGDSDAFTQALDLNILIAIFIRLLYYPRLHCHERHRKFI